MNQSPRPPARLADGLATGDPNAPRMSNRYSLRFETGERRGEQIPLTGSKFTIGRRPGNSLQVLETSVSGKHAELLVSDEQILLRDLGSTNGTRVGGEKVLESRLNHGAEVYFGQVGFTLIDVEAEAPPLLEDPKLPREAPISGYDEQATMVQNAPEELVVSSALLERARSSKRGGSWLLPVFVLLLAGGGAGWWFTSQGGAEASLVRPVLAVEGDLLAGSYSFEGEDALGWEDAEGASAGFLRDSSARVSGEVGVSAELAAGEWARLTSPAVSVRGRQGLELRATLRGIDAEGAAGIEFSRSSSEGEDRTFHARPAMAWSAAAEEDYTEVVVTAVVPEGYDRARVVLTGYAEEGGVVEADDVSLVKVPAPAISSLDENRLALVGDPAQGFVFGRVDHVLISRFETHAAGLPHGAQGARGTISADKSEIGWNMSVRPPAGAAELSVVVESAIVRQGFATIAESGYMEHSADFEREGVTDVVMGSNIGLMRLRFSDPIDLRGRSSGGGFQLGAPLGGPLDVVLQVRFEQEREEAGKLRVRAEDAYDADSYGQCLVLWTELLDRYPFEERHTITATEVIAQLTRKGLDEINEIEGELERARFFRLVDLFRQCRASAESIGQRYAGSDVAVRASELVEVIEGEIATLEIHLQREERRRLESIRAVLSASGSDRLSRRVSDYLEDNFHSVEDDAETPAPDSNGENN